MIPADLTPERLREIADRHSLCWYGHMTLEQAEADQSALRAWADVLAVGEQETAPAKRQIRIYKALYDDAGNFVGHEPNEGCEHRTVGQRAWCLDCSEWCYPDSPCPRCERAAGEQEPAARESALTWDELCSKCGHAPKDHDGGSGYCHQQIGYRRVGGTIGERLFPCPCSSLVPNGSWYVDTQAARRPGEQVLKRAVGEQVEPRVPPATARAHLHDPAELERWFEKLARTIALDFDGTLHPYTEGWCGSVPADEPPVPGALTFVSQLHEQGYRLVVFSCRCDHAEGMQGTVEWLTREGFMDFIDDVTHLKPAAIAYVDDRAVPFTGGWGSVLDGIDRLAGRAHGAAPASVSSPTPTREDAIEEVTQIIEDMRIGHSWPEPVSPATSSEIARALVNRGFVAVSGRGDSGVIEHRAFIFGRSETDIRDCHLVACTCGWEAETEHPIEAVNAFALHAAEQETTR